MIPKTKTLFISYRSSDATQVDKIARDLGLLRYDDDTPCYSPWQDKHNLPPASPNWWDAIVQAIIDCHVFVFFLSRDSLNSEICRAELEYARRRNRPIIVVVLAGEYLLNPQSGKYDLHKETWSYVPDWLGESQFLFYGGAEFYGLFDRAVGGFERAWPRDISAPRPLNPDGNGSKHALYESACDYAERLAFAEAEKHFDTLVRRNDPDYADASAQWLEIIRLYAELIEIGGGRSTAFIFNKKWASYTALYPKEFLEGIFDPKGFAGHNRANADLGDREGQPAPVVPPSPPTQHPPVVQRVKDRSPLTASPPLQQTKRRRSEEIMPSPFVWVDIPAGRVTLEKKDGFYGGGQTFEVPAFAMAKYPVTNSQYAKFIEAGGYKKRHWWTEKGWDFRMSEGRQKPEYWDDNKYNGELQPVIGISWYEAMAFCIWLSDVTGENITLPTEQQWQRAAQGDEAIVYPWGNRWDITRCNNYRSGHHVPTPVTTYEGKGNSPFDVVDMAGNTWDWCLTSDDREKSYVTRGGSLMCREKLVKTTYRQYQDANYLNTTYGFRCVTNYRNLFHTKD